MLNELQINRWYELNTLPVRAINMEGLNTLFEEIDNLKPIPLTEELLLKCGFEKSHVTNFTLEFENHELEININKYYSWLNNKDITPILYLHSLQNIFFALTNQELKIIL